MSNDGEARFRKPKTIYEEGELVGKSILLKLSSIVSAAIVSAANWPSYILAG